MNNSYSFYELNGIGSEIVYGFDSVIYGQYLVTFRSASHRFNSSCTVCQLIYEVNFIPLQRIVHKKGRDPRIRPTIAKIIRYFIEERGCPILYVCDESDSRHNCRSKLFSNWFTKLKDDTFRHQYNIIKYLGLELIVGIIGFTNDIHFETYFEELERDA